MRLSRVIPLALAGWFACADEGAPPTDGEAVGVLELELGETSLSGSFALGDSLLVFEAEQLADNVFVSRVELHGLVLEATQDRRDANGVVIDRDGWTAADGSDTQMTEEDRVVIAAFVQTLETDVPDIAKMTPLTTSFDEVVVKWAEWVPVIPLRTHEIFETARSGNICTNATCTNGSYTGNCANRFSTTWHDCSTCSFSGGCITKAQLGNHCGTGGDARHSSSTSNVCTQPFTDKGHSTTNVYGVGECYGRYGAGCGSGTSYNWESADHDNCVRNGHWITSSWCSDELLSTHSDGNCY